MHVVREDDTREGDDASDKDLGLGEQRQTIHDHHRLKKGGIRHQTK